MSSTVTAVNGHACLYCGAWDCTSRWDHERWWRGTEQYARLSPAERLECPRCHQPVDSGPCGADLLAGAVS